MKKKWRTYILLIISALLLLWFIATRFCVVEVDPGRPDPKEEVALKQLSDSVNNAAENKVIKKHRRDSLKAGVKVTKTPKVRLHLDEHVPQNPQPQNPQP